MKRRIILSTLLILIVICTMIGMSYAYYQLKLTDTHELITKTEIPSCVPLSLSGGNQITLTGDQSAPVSDVKALGSNNYMYSFSVTNDCANKANVKIALTPSLDTNMPIRAIKYAVYEQNGTKPVNGNYLIDSTAQSLTEDIVREVKEQSQIDVEIGYEILSLELNARETKTYNLYVWIDYYEGDKSQTGVYNNSTMNKSFIGSVVVTGYEDLGEYQLAYAIYSETDNSLVFYKNYDKPQVGETYNGKVTTAIFTGFETDEYIYDANTETLNTPWFSYANLIKKVSVADEISPKSTIGWFFLFQNAESIDLTNLDTSQVTSMTHMLDRAGYASENFEIHLGDKFDTSNVIDMSSMFQGMGAKDTDFTLELGNKFDTSKVQNMTNLFNVVGYASTVFELDLGDKFDTSNVYYMSKMFRSCGYNSTLFKLDLGDKFETSNVINMKQMFQSCGQNTPNFEINLGSNFNTSNVTNMSYMFQYIGKNNPNFELNLGTLFDTSQVADMSYMFGGCESLKTVDVSGWNTSNVENMYHMFNGCSQITTLDLSLWNTSKVTALGSMFISCENLTSLDLSNFDTGNVLDFDNVFRGCKKLTTIGDTSNWNTGSAKYMRYMFYECFKLQNLDTSNWNVSNVTRMDYIFHYCQELAELNVARWDTSKVLSMRSMFAGCKKLATLDVSNFKTGNVQLMNCMFEGCSGLTELNVSQFDTSNVTNMASMFRSCSKLTSLNLANFNTSKVKDMGYMFYNSRLITALDLGTWNTANVQNMNSMFGGYDNQPMSITSITGLNNWDTSSLTDIGNMFYECRSLTSLDLSNWNTDSITIMTSAFYNCQNLITIYVSSIWNTNSVTEYNSMFKNCFSLVGGTGTIYNANNVGISYAKIDEGVSSPGYFTLKNA